MTSPRCSLCGRADRLDRHHVTGRPGPGLDYFDDLVLPLCRRHHTGVEGLHPVLRVVGLDFLPPGRDPLAHRLRRAAVHCRLVADAGRPLVLDASSTGGLVHLLLAAADVLDAGAR